MRIRTPGLALLFVLVAACGSEDDSPSAGAGGNEESGIEAGPAVPKTTEKATLVGRFITTEGEHVVTADGKFAIHVVRDGQLLNYRFEVRTVTEDPGGSSVDRNTTSGPEAAAIDANSNWFIHVESPHRYWVFDGDDGVEVIEYSESSPTKSTTAMTDLESMSERLLKEMPDPVKERIPVDVLARRR